MSSSSESPRDTDMISDRNGNAEIQPNEGTLGDDQGGNSSVPKPKRLACMICRKRKLKCDGTKPSCSTCSRLGHSCAYDENRRKSGPKRGYVKALEERLKHVETLLKSQDGTTASDSVKSITVEHGARQKQHPVAPANFTVTDPSIGIASSRDMDRWNFNAESPQNAPMEDFNFNSNLAINMNNLDSNFTWEMIGLGLEEPLPPQETIDELHQIYFEKVHPSLPMIHKFRYLAAMNLAPSQRPPVCLRYAMWTAACSVTEKYQDMKELFYQRARKYLESDYIKGYGEHMISVAHAQTHIILASYEFKMMFFPRAWMSTGSAVRLVQMMGLHRLDGAGLDVKQCLPPPRDWTEREERRRTFWMAFCEDRYASIGTGWPMTVDENDILTNLPSSEDAFNMSRPEQSESLSEAMGPSGVSKISEFGGIVLMSCLFGRNLIHLHRPDPDDKDGDLNGGFWKRHRTMDNILLNITLCLPSALKLPAGLGSANVVFTNMCIYTSTICLHQAAIFKADKNKLPASVSAESKIRCITAANEIASIMRMISHMDLTMLNPFISFCLYVAARVFVQYLKSRPDDSQTADSLRFLLSAMNALKRMNPLTESFLVQLDVDLEALCLRIPKLKSTFPRSADVPGVRMNGMNLNRGAPCDPDTADSGENGALGVMAYRNECHFIKTVDDDGNPAMAPDIVEPSIGGVSQTPSTQSLSSQSWALGEQQTMIPTRERGAGAYSNNMIPIINFGGGEVESGSTNDMSGTSPDAGQSNRPTPSSSGANSEQRPGAGGPPGLSSSSGRGSFDASPISPNQNLNTERGSDHGKSGNNFYPDPPAFGILPPGLVTGMTPPATDHQRFSMPEVTTAGDFAVPIDWSQDMAGQGGLGGQGAGMTPIADGMLRSIMAMGSLDTMDLAWDGNP